MPRRYKIYQLSAKAIASYAEEKENGVYEYKLSIAATERCKTYTVKHEQYNNALFHQIMCVINGEDFKIDDEVNLVTDLSDVIFYIDFKDIFDRDSKYAIHNNRQEKCKSMFRTEGIELDFGKGPKRYVSFEHSNSMGRLSRHAFIREDICEKVRKRIMLDMKIGMCQLSKLYSYNGLMFSDGTRIDGIEIDKPHRVIVIENPIHIEKDVPVITVKADTDSGSMKKYSRVESVANVEVQTFDGEGLISKQYAKVIDKVYCGKHIHHSFQIRMPYVKGMLHEVDFKDFLESCDENIITDIWGIEHNVKDVDIILTKSMFKGYNWLGENNMTWQDYWDKFKKYNHALYITNVSKVKQERLTELNYQFLSTLSISPEEFRPKDLPMGWDHSPMEDERNWLTKQTETEYYNLCANEDYRREYFLNILDSKSVDKTGKKYILAKILKKNPLFISESIYSKELEDRATHIANKYSIGTLIVEGETRYLSGDLIEFLRHLIKNDTDKDGKRGRFTDAAEKNFMSTFSFHAPGMERKRFSVCVLLRNPHIARNEEVQLNVHLEQVKRDNMRDYYLGHLTDIVIIEPKILAAERLGGADYDGDMVRIIIDPLVNKCVKRNYTADELDNISNLPLLQIPTEKPLISDSTSWEARFETIRNAFSSRVGQISNAAFNRSLLAYDENLGDDARKKHREDVEMLAILTGLEIDSAKSGVKPDLSEYLGNNNRKRSAFLEYKKQFEDKENRTGIMNERYSSKLQDAIDKCRDAKASIETLPVLADDLKKNTPKIKAKKVKDNLLFSFATSPNWKNELDKEILEQVQDLIKEYKSCLNRIRIANRQSVNQMRRKTDVNRILFLRGQDDTYFYEDLYALFSDFTPGEIADIRNAIVEEQWQLMPKDERVEFLSQWLEDEKFHPYFELFADFRYNGYRLFGDLICDIDDDNSLYDKKKLYRDGDSDRFNAMMEAYENKISSDSYREAVAKKCREFLDEIIKPKLAVKYAVALGARDFMWDVLFDKVEENVLRRGKDD